MKILHVTPTYWPAVRYGGPIRSVHGLCAGLVALGHEVKVLTTNVDGPGVLDVPLGMPVHRDGVDVRYFRTGVGRRLYRAPAMARAFGEAVSRADIVHINAVYLWPGWMAARSAAAAEVPYVVSPRGMLAPALIARRSRLAKEAWIRLIERRTLSRAAAIHVTAETEAAGIRALGLDLAPMVEVPNGVDLPERANAPSRLEENTAWLGAPSDHRLLFLGRLSWKKGLDRLLAALAHLSSTRLVIAGNDDEHLTPKLRANAERLGVGARVHYIGEVAGAQKWSLLRSADLLVLPSLNENFGIVVLEALAVGTPVVVTSGVGAAAIVTRHDLGAVVVGNAVEPLAAAIGGLLADRKRRNSMGARGMYVVRQVYSWDVVAHQMVNAYQAAILSQSLST